MMAKDVFKVRDEILKYREKHLLIREGNETASKGEIMNGRIFYSKLIISILMYTLQKYYTLVKNKVNIPYAE